MLSLGELAGTQQCHQPLSGESWCCTPTKVGPSQTPMFLLWEALGNKPVACSSCPAQEQHLPRLLHGQDLQGQSGPLRSSLGGAVGDTLALGVRTLLPVEPKPPPVLYSACQIPMATRALPGLWWVPQQCAK